MYCVSLFQGCYRPPEHRGETKKIEICLILSRGRRVRSRKDLNPQPHKSRVICVYYQLYNYSGKNRMLTLQACPYAPWVPGTACNAV